VGVEALVLPEGLAEVQLAVMRQVERLVQRSSIHYHNSHKIVTQEHCGVHSYHKVVVLLPDQVPLAEVPEMEQEVIPDQGDYHSSHKMQLLKC
jgi:hypothetical protein